MQDIAKYDIPIFNFSNNEEVDEDIATENEALRSLIPFAVVSAEADTLGQHENNGNHTPYSSHPQSSMPYVKKRGRKYPWGFIEIDNPRHCDFSSLRTVLFNSHLQDLKDITQNVLYENYRTEKLSPQVDISGVSIVAAATNVQSPKEQNSTAPNVNLANSAQSSTEEISTFRQKLKSRFGSGSSSINGKDAAFSVGNETEGRNIETVSSMLSK